MQRYRDHPRCGTLGLGGKAGEKRQAGLQTVACIDAPSGAVRVPERRQHERDADERDRDHARDPRQCQAKLRCATRSDGRLAEGRAAGRRGCKAARLGACMAAVSKNRSSSS